MSIAFGAWHLARSQFAMVKWWGFRVVESAKMIGMIGISQQCLIPKEVLTTPTRSKGQILPAKADGVLTTTAISRDHSLESLMTILALVVHPIRLARGERNRSQALAKS